MVAIGDDGTRKWHLEASKKMAARLAALTQQPPTEQTVKCQNVTSFARSPKSHKKKLPNLWAKHCTKFKDFLVGKNLYDKFNFFTLNGYLFFFGITQTI